MGTRPATAMAAEWISSSTPGADEGDAEQVALVFVDDHAGASGVAVGLQARPGTAAPRSTSTTRMRCPVPGAFGLVGGELDRPGRRSQKNTCGSAR